MSYISSKTGKKCMTVPQNFYDAGAIAFHYVVLNYLYSDCTISTIPSEPQRCKFTGTPSTKITIDKRQIDTNNTDLQDIFFTVLCVFSRLNTVCECNIALQSLSLFIVRLVLETVYWYLEELSVNHLMSYLTNCVTLGN